MTNYEKIKNMSIEEMALFFDDITSCKVRECNGCPFADAPKNKGLFPECNVSTKRKWLEMPAKTNYKKIKDMGCTQLTATLTLLFKECVEKSNPKSENWLSAANAIIGGWLASK